LGSDEIRAIVEDRAGDLWVGTLGGGLSRFRNGRFTTLTTTNGLSSNEVWALHEHPEGVLWIGTDNGLSRFEAGQITSFTRAQGLPDSLVNSVLADDSGRVWVGHDRGIYAVEMRHLLEVARGRRTRVDALNFDESDGLLSEETNGQKSYPAACKTRDGRLWFPTTRGVAIIDPAKLSLSEAAPLVVIEAVRANGKAVFGAHPQAASGKEPPPGSTPRGVDLRLPPGGARVLEFQYTANTFTAPEKARFRYRLIGLDRNWIDAGTRRQAYFANLAPGNYRFEVLAGNHHGVWQEKNSSVAFQLMPFYYQTWWFYAVCGAGVAALGALAIRWRVRELRRIYNLQRTNALNEQRRRIARDIHDELGSSLTHILQLSDPARTSAGKPNGRDQKAERIATIAEEAVDNIGEIVWANNPEYDTLEDLVAYLREYAANCFADTNVHVRCQFPDVVPCRTVSGLFRRHLVLLMKEALHNVAKHADARQVDVRLSLREGTLELAVMDDGRGLPAEGAMRQGNGLTNMRARVDELEGEFLINSEVGKGTKIHVVVPLSNP
jgi:signal transduction histidine kinase